MKRRIQFRGYNLKNKKWLYGYYLVNRGKHYIVQDEVVDPFVEESDFEVDPKSVGQFTGVKDVKGVDIYEGDKMNTYHGENKVVFREGRFGFHPYDCLLFLTCYVGDYEVIGNEYEENIKSFQSVEKKVLDDWHKLDEEIFSKQHELIMENRKR